MALGYFDPDFGPVMGTPVNFIGDFFGNLGNSWQGGEDQAMYADPRAGAGGGLPFATYDGVVNSPPGQAGVAVGTAVHNVIGAAANFGEGLARGGGFLLGAAIVAIALLHESR